LGYGIETWHDDDDDPFVDPPDDSVGVVWDGGSTTGCLQIINEAKARYCGK